MYIYIYKYTYMCMYMYVYNIYVREENLGDEIASDVHYPDESIMVQEFGSDLSIIFYIYIYRSTYPYLYFCFNFDVVIMVYCIYIG